MSTVTIVSGLCTTVMACLTVLAVTGGSEPLVLLMAVLGLIAGVFWTTQSALDDQDENRPPPRTTQPPLRPRNPPLLFEPGSESPRPGGRHRKEGPS
jgi:hypothetical protein